MKTSVLKICLIIAIAACSPPEETFEVRQQPLNEAVYASGQVMPASYHFVEANIAERIMEIFVSEGDSVEQGNILAVLGTPSENRQMDLLSRQVGLAREMAGEQSAILDELQTRARLAREQYFQDSLNAVRYQELASERAVSMREAEQARLSAESSRTEYLTLQQQYASRRNELNRNLLQAEQQLAQLSQTREGKVLASPINGKVFSVYHKEGNLVQPGEPFMLVGTPNKYMLELLVDERDIVKIKLGQKIYFQAETLPNVQYEARVSKIIPVLQRDTRSFEVEAEVVSGEALFPQSSVEANIVIRENFDAFVIPADFLLPGDSVLLQRDGVWVKSHIARGIRSNNWIEVISGLSEGDLVRKEE